MTSPGDATLARLVRDEAGRVVTSLARATGDLDVAEEAVQDAIVEALQAWRRDGPPPNPGGWLHTAARRNALDRLRRRARHRERLTLLPEPPPSWTGSGMDDRLRLLFLCCHPALSPTARVALTLRAVLGLTTAEIARAFLTSEPTAAQRIVRAKRKIVAAGIGFDVPHHLDERLDHALAVVYLAYNEGYLTTAGDVSFRRDLAEDSIWLAALVATELPRQPEVLGLLALLLLLHARQRARFDPAGGLVLLADQDRSQWDTASIAEGVALLEKAAALGHPGRYQLQGAIAAVHAEAPSWEATDWPQILILYELLRRYDDSPVVRLNRAVALAHVAGAEAALAEVDALEPALRTYHLLHATRAELLRMLGRDADARAADVRALALTANPAEKALLRRRLTASPGPT